MTQAQRTIIAADMHDLILRHRIATGTYASVLDPRDVQRAVSRDLTRLARVVLALVGGEGEELRP